MKNLSDEDVIKIINEKEFSKLDEMFFWKHGLAIRCNKGKKDTKGDGFNLDIGDRNYKEYATALFASIDFAQAYILSDKGKLKDYCLLMMKDCAVSSKEKYTYKEYYTLFKCSKLGPKTTTIKIFSMDEKPMILARKVINKILKLINSQ